LSRFDTMKSYTPSFVAKNGLLKKLLEAQASEVEKLSVDLQELLDQMYPQTATWGLSYWEEFCGMPISDADDEVRRAQIISKLSRFSPVSPKMIHSMAHNILKLNVSVIESVAAYTFRINIESNNKNIDIISLAKAIEEIKPAHLDFDMCVENSTNININCNGINNIFNYVPCGTIRCGTHPLPATLGTTLPAQLSIEIVPESQSFDYKLCGIDPGISTLGFTFPSSTDFMTCLEAFDFDYKADAIECGTEPDMATAGTAGDTEISAEGEGDTQSFSYVPCGTTPCGTN